MWNRAPFRRRSWCGCTSHTCLKLPLGMIYYVQRQPKWASVSRATGRSFTLFSPHNSAFSHCCAVIQSVESGEIWKGRGKTTMSRCRFPAPNSTETASLSWTETSSPSEPHAWPPKPDSPSPSVLTMPTGRFCLDPAGCCTEGSRLNPAPTKVTDKHHVDFSGTKWTHLFCKTWLVLHPRIPLGAHHHTI